MPPITIHYLGTLGQFTTQEYEVPAIGANIDLQANVTYPQPAIVGVVQSITEIRPNEWNVTVK